MLVVEVMSESTKSTDYRAKRAEYSAVDIPEYWKRDLLKERVTVCTLLEGWYEVTEYSGGSEIASTLFSSLKLVAKDALSG